jgi:CRP-like cAMP-binding protein
MDMKSILAQSGLFEDVPRQTFSFIVENCELIDCEDGEIIFVEDDTEPRGMYIVVSGEVIITTEVEAGKEQHAPGQQNYFLTRLGPQDSFGEMSLIDGGPRSATATAQGPTSLCFIADDVVRKTVDRDPRAAYCIMRNVGAIVCRRLRESDFAVKHLL